MASDSKLLDPPPGPNKGQRRKSKETLTTSKTVDDIFAAAAELARKNTKGLHKKAVSTFTGTVPSNWVSFDRENSDQPGMPPFSKPPNSVTSPDASAGSPPRAREKSPSVSPGSSPRHDSVAPADQVSPRFKPKPPPGLPPIHVVLETHARKARHARALSMPINSLGPVRVDALKYLQEGAVFLKYGRRGAPHFRKVQLVNGNKRLQWYSNKKDPSESQIDLEDVHEILLGQNTDVFRKASAKSLEEGSFSIIYGPHRSSLDLVAKDYHHLKVWTDGLESLVREIRAGHDVSELQALLVSFDPGILRLHEVPPPAPVSPRFSVGGPSTLDSPSVEDEGLSAYPRQWENAVRRHRPPPPPGPPPAHLRPKSGDLSGAPTVVNLSEFKLESPPAPTRHRLSSSSSSNPTSLRSASSSVDDGRKLASSVSGGAGGSQNVDKSSSKLPTISAAGELSDSDDEA